MVFTIELAFPRGAVLKIKRDLSSLCTIRNTILSNGGEPARLGSFAKLDNHPHVCLMDISSIYSKMKDLESRKGIYLPCEMNGVSSRYSTQARCLFIFKHILNLG